MKKESWIAIFGRWFFLILISILLLMNYWSSLILEEKVIEIQENLRELDSKFEHLEERQTRSQKENSQEGSTSHLEDSQIPNLLSQDPFYAETLPNLLPADFEISGIRKEASLGRPINLHPFSNWSQVASWNNQCTVSAATNHFGIYETYAPDMGWKMEERTGEDGKPEYWIFLRADVYWKPLNPHWFTENIQLAPLFLEPHQVTAYDYKFYLDAVMNPQVHEGQAVALRNFLRDIEELNVLDDVTFVVKWKTKEIENENGELVHKMKYTAKQWTGGLKPLARFVYQHFADGTKIIEGENYRESSIWAQNFTQHWAKNIIVSCGPWTFDGMSENRIIFERNSQYFQKNAILVEGLQISFKEIPDAIWQEFQAGNLDSYSIQPDQLAELENFLESKAYQEQIEKDLAIERLDFLARSYSYIGWNQATPYFNSPKVRRAMTMAIDRRLIIRNILKGMGEELTGPFFKGSPSYNQSIQPWPYDPHQARRLLAEEGWFDSNGDDILDKEIDGEIRPFRFLLTYYVKNPTTKAICEYVSSQLKEIGVECLLNGVDIADLSSMFDDKSFDAICLGWALGSPPEDPRQLWYSAGAKEKGSSNAVGFTNREADLIINALEYEYNPEKRLQLYHRFHEIIHEQAPYTFLYIPKAAFIYREYLKNVFIPADRQDLIPGANVEQPQSNIFWIDRQLW